MPVLLDRGPSGNAVAGSRRTISASDIPASRGIQVALINNMPDGALEATERQFVALLGEASGDTVVRVKLFALPEVPRTEPARRYLGEAYRAIGDLWDSQPDGLIVTGTEPLAAALWRSSFALQRSRPRRTDGRRIHHPLGVGASGRRCVRETLARHVRVLPGTSRIRRRNFVPRIPAGRRTLSQRRARQVPGHARRILRRPGKGAPDRVP